jgi:hypothetical protein
MRSSRSRLVLVKSDLELPRIPGPKSTPARRLLAGLFASAVQWGSIVALVRGSIWMALLGMLLARALEWVAAEQSHW